MRSYSKFLIGLAVSTVGALGLHSLANASQIKISSGKCLDVHKPDMGTNGGRVQIWTCSGSLNQDWTFDASGRLVNGGGKCLDVHAPEIGTDGGRIQVWECHNNDNQKWSMSGSGEIRVNNSDKCLDVHAPEIVTDGGRVQLWSCNGLVNQKWTFEPTAVPGQSNAEAIRDWIDSLPHLPIEQSSSGNWSAVTGLPVGIDGQQRTGGRFVNREAELAILRSYSDIMWPGALVQGASISNNSFAPIGLPRPAGRVRVDGSFVGDTVAKFRDLPSIGAGEVEFARESILTQINARDAAGESFVSFATAGTVREGMVKLGVAYSSASTSVNANASLNSNFNENTVFARYVQKFYNVAFDPNVSLNLPFFAESVTLDQVKRFTSPDNPPLFVSQVTYGRILVIQVTARKSVTDIQAAVNAALTNVSGSVQGTFRETLDASTVRVFSVGATGELTARTLTSAMNVATVGEAFHKYITDGAVYRPDNPGRPIAFIMRYMGGSGSQGNRVYDEAIAQMVTDESPEIQLSAREHCIDNVQLWRGSPGGGWKESGLTGKLGDFFRFIPNNSTFVRSLRVGEPARGTPPAGWAQPIPGPFDFQFPIGNRPPFSLIGRFGERSNIGMDITGGERNSTSGTGPSDSFHIGQGTSITIGQTVAGPLGDMAYSNTGQLYLGINDSEAAQLGFPSYKWEVRVCQTPSIY
jgi:hypothetical protein